jgi:hypothetical protein
MDKPVEKPFVNYGWKCPVCGRGNAPWSATCPCTPYPPTPPTWPFPGDPIWY